MFVQMAVVIQLEEKLKVGARLPSPLEDAADITDFQDDFLAIRFV
jgi:hypothetical protein